MKAKLKVTTSVHGVALLMTSVERTLIVLVLCAVDFLLDSGCVWSEIFPARYIGMNAKRIYFSTMAVYAQ